MKTMKYITYVCVALLSVILYGCSDEVVNNSEPAAEGTLLNLYVGDIVTPGTRLAELGGAGSISEGTHPTNGDDKKNIGLYIYYEDDYKADILTKPYVRNLECEVKDGKIVPVDGSDIYIYDRMTIVAFYPYNSAADDYTFTSKDDEKRYPITENDYSYQYYIPYRAQTNVNPTNAYLVRLHLVPQQTVKIQVVLVSDDPDLFPDATTKTDGVVKIVPSIDPQDAGSGEDKRENWVDIIEQPYGSAPSPTSSGMHVQRFTSYIWKNNEQKGTDNPHHGDNPNHYDNTFKKGDVLLQSDKLTLFFPEDLEVREGNVYRYGYNLTTGEMFIPTSDNLIYDASTLAGGSGGYQVCDIYLTDKGDWTPVNFSGTYDGGGHAVKNMKITQVPVDGNVGLFGSVTGSSVIKNLHLESPEIEVENTDPNQTLNIGGLVGQLNRALTPEEEAARIQAIENNLRESLPPGLPESVIQALLAELLKEDTGQGTSSVQGCKVSQPTIKVTGENVIVGGLAGIVGDDQSYKGEIKDSYVSEGSIEVNKDVDPNTYEKVWVGAFAGLVNGGSISRSYTTSSAEGYMQPTRPDTDPVEVAQGFTNVVDPVPAGTGVTDSFTKTLKGNTVDGVKEFGTSEWPSWGTSDEWPKANSTLDNYWGNMGSTPSNYPTLVWESRLQ